VNSEVKQKWLDALRSGEYEQGQAYLRTPKGYCCLGVLCDLAAKAEVIPEPELENGAYWYDGDRYYLSRKVQEWAGLEFNNPSSETASDALANLNDEGLTFTQIADFVERDF